VSAAELREAFSRGPETLNALGIPAIDGALGGADVAIGGYWNGRDWEYPLYWSMEDVGLLAGGIGPQVVASACARPVRVRKPLLAEKVLHPLRAVLSMEKYKGWVEVACTVGYDGESVARYATIDPVVGPALSQIFKGSGGFLDETEAHPFMFVAQLKLWLPTGEQIKEWAIGRGKTAKLAYAAATLDAESLGLSDLCYRNDAGARIPHDLELIEEAGWLR